MRKVSPYPDELVYSICSRIHFYSGSIMTRRTKRKLFGNVEKTIHILWPTRLEYFSNEYGLGLTVNELVSKHTLYPYYTRFMSEKKSNKFFEAMVYGNSRANPAAYLKLIQNITPRLYLCPLCVKEDNCEFGEPYWHRSHHLPGSKVCYKHNVYLLAECPVCNESFVNSSNKELNITPKFCSNGHSLEFVVENKNKDLLHIAQENYSLLNSELKFSIEDVIKKFLVYAKVKKYQNVESTVILYDKLVPEFIKRFPTSFLDFIGISIQGEEIQGINRIFQKRERFIHPLHVLLLILFFGGTIENFLSQEIKYTPFGEGPWPCLNKLCPSYLQDVINEVDLKNSNRFAKPRGNFKCLGCGFIYSRLGTNDVQTETYQYDLILRTGEIWDAKFEELLNKNIVYLYEMTEELGVGKVFLRLKLKELFGEINLNQSRAVTMKQIRRSRIKQMITENPHLTVAEIAKIDSRIIKWMQSFDAEWLRENVKSTTRRLGLEDRRNEFLKTLHGLPRTIKTTKKELKQINPSNYAWLIAHDKQWMMEQLPNTVIRKPIKTLEERREQFLKLLNKYPNATRSELNQLESANYKWLMQNDVGWISLRQPPVKLNSNKKNNITLQQRRKTFLRLRDEFPNLSRSELQRQDLSNYTWLRMHDSAWFEHELPSPIDKIGSIKPRFTLLERRNFFMNIYKENPTASPKEIRKLSGSNYTWLHTHDFLWLKERQPSIRKNESIHKRRRVINKSLEERRKEFISIRNENPYLSRSGLKENYQSLYVWLMTNDKYWFSNQLPPIVPRNRKLN